MQTILNYSAVLASISACLAAIVALIPIYTASTARKAKARNLRMRIATKLTRIRPTFAAISSEYDDSSASVILDSDGLVKVLEQLEALLVESESLLPKEQDRISAFVANLELMIPMCRAGELSSDEAVNLILLCDRVIAELEENGMLSTEPHQPWKEDSNA